MRRDMNRVGIALICLIVLQWMISLSIYCIMAASYGQHIVFYGFTPNALLKTLWSLESAASKIPAAMPFALFFATLIGNTIPFILCARACGEKMSSMFSRPNVDGGTAALFGVVAVGASLIISIMVNIASIFLKLVHLKLVTPSFNIPWKSPLGAAALIIATVIIAPLTEEFICRGVLLRVFRKYGDVFAVVASSLVWALLHGNFVQGLPVFFMGLFLGMLALKSGSIIPTFIIHAANNILALIESTAVGSNFLVRFYLGSINIFMVLTAIVLFSVFYKKFRIDNDGHSAHGFAAFFTCIPLIITIIFCAFTTVMSVRPL